jgi:hypothetical protein|nr:MAG TPA: hypothetical protein [Caudoviricetes sp.]
MQRHREKDEVNHMSRWGENKNECKQKGKSFTEFVYDDSENPLKVRYRVLRKI